MSPRVLVLGQFGCVLLLLATVQLFAKFIGGVSDFLLFIYGLPALLLSAVVVLGWALVPPRWAKLRVAALALLVGTGLVALSPRLRRTGDRLFFESRRADLEAFTADILAYGRIHEMSDGLRHFKELNGELIALRHAEVDTLRAPGLRPTLPVARVLARDGIDRQTYDVFRERLRELKFIEFEVHRGFVAFVYDGMLDNVDGYLLVRAGHEPPALNSEIFSSQLIAIKPLGSGWYWFATT